MDNKGLIFFLKMWPPYHRTDARKRDKRLAQGSSAFSPAVIGYETDLSRRAPDSHNPPQPFCECTVTGRKSSHSRSRNRVCVTVSHGLGLLSVQETPSFILSVCHSSIVRICSFVFTYITSVREINAKVMCCTL